MTWPLRSFKQLRINYAEKSCHASSFISIMPRWGLISNACVNLRATLSRTWHKSRWMELWYPGIWSAVILWIIPKVRTIHHFHQITHKKGSHIYQWALKCDSLQVHFLCVCVWVWVLCVRFPLETVRIYETLQSHSNGFITYLTYTVDVCVRALLCVCVCSLMHACVSTCVSANAIILCLRLLPRSALPLCFYRVRWE